MVEEAAKVSWLQARLQGFVDQGDVLVFAAQKVRVDEVVDRLKASGFRCAGYTQSSFTCIPLPLNAMVWSRGSEMRNHQ